ncbi:MAG: FAD-dependent oxidoreductase [Oscillospiraceae bacterium]|mgnify:CR=1 FL=1|nr:FAD-dependent oxidoreductase [Oscillospiraceae bacterium]
MVTNKENLFKLGKKLTDRLPQKLGLKKITEEDPEYWGLCNVLDDEMVEILLAVPQRKPLSFEEIKKITKWSDEEKLAEKLEEMSQLGVMEYNWENEDHHKQWLVPLFVPGSAEFLNMKYSIQDKYPEVTEFFQNMTRLPLEGVTQLLPPGGAGVGMHVIPVEKAIEHESQSVSIEHLSHWLKKYDYYEIGICSCRNCETRNNRGSGDLKEHWCIAVGDCAKYCFETGKEGLHNASYEQVMDTLRRAEEEGYVHQITNIDGENKIFAICNCAPGTCYALRTSQLFNTPNLSASAYRAHVTTENCVACGKCVEVCPAGAIKLGQKLCTKNGPVVYPKQELPDETRWGKDKWDEDYKTHNMENCHDSGTAPCKAACPAHIAVQGYIKMAAEGRYLDALKLIKQDNPFPAVCGSICNRACEDACTRGSVDAPVAIDEIKKYIAELELNEKDRYIPPRRTKRLSTEDYDEKIAVIGAGPSGLSCAYYLSINGYPVTVFDRNKVPGGMLTHGIPSFRLDRKVINAEIDVLKKMGVKFKMGVEVGKDVTIEQLRMQGFKAFYVAIGAQKSAKLGIPGEELEGVYGGVDFLRDVNLGKEVKLGKKVAVVGGGNVAMDVVRTAIRVGAEEACIVYRRSADEMPADKEEVAEAMAEGVKFCYLNAPAEIVADKNGKVAGLKVEIMELGEPDEKGKRKPVGTGKFEVIKCSAVIGAVGQQIDWGELDTGAMVKGKKNAAEADGVTLQTAQPDIFVGGDCFTGPKFAIDAIAAGREGAVSIHRYVQPGQSLTLARNLRNFYELNKNDIVLGIESFDKPGRQQIKHDPKKAKTMKNDRITFTEEEVKKEASRCLGCGACIADQNKCIGCGLCTTKCEFDAIHLTRDFPEASTMWTAEDKVKALAPYAIKRAAKIAIKDIKAKIGK